MFGAMKIEMSSGSFDKKQLIMNTYRETKTLLYKTNVYVFLDFFYVISIIKLGKIQEHQTLKP